jgi:hypothetical protein
MSYPTVVAFGEVLNNHLPICLERELFGRVMYEPVEAEAFLQQAFFKILKVIGERLALLCQVYED